MSKFRSNLANQNSSSKYINRAHRMGGLHRSLKISQQANSNKQAKFYFLPAVEAFSIDPNQAGQIAHNLQTQVGQITHDLQVQGQLNVGNLQEFVATIKIPSGQEASDYFWTIYDPNKVPNPQTSPLEYVIREATYLLDSDIVTRLGMTLTDSQMANKNPFAGILESGQTKYAFLTQSGLNATQLKGRIQTVIAMDAFLTSAFFCVGDGNLGLGPAIEGANYLQTLAINRIANQTNHSSDIDILNINTNTTNVSKSFFFQALDGVSKIGNGISKIGVSVGQNLLLRAQNFTAIFNIANPNKHLDGAPRLSFAHSVYVNSGLIPLGNITGTIELDPSFEIANFNGNGNFSGSSINNNTQCNITVMPEIDSSSRFLGLNDMACGRNFGLFQASYAINSIDMLPANYQMGVVPTLPPAGNYSSRLVMPLALPSSQPLGMISPP